MPNANAEFILERWKNAQKEDEDYQGISWTGNKFVVILEDMSEIVRFLWQLYVEVERIEPNSALVRALLQQFV